MPEKLVGKFSLTELGLVCVRKRADHVICRTPGGGNVGFSAFEPTHLSVYDSTTTDINEFGLEYESTLRGYVLSDATHISYCVSGPTLEEYAQFATKVPPVPESKPTGRVAVECPDFTRHGCKWSDCMEPLEALAQIAMYKDYLTTVEERISNASRT